jgi:hypothetical protein
MGGSQRKIIINPAPEEFYVSRKGEADHARHNMYKIYNSIYNS